ncbi:MAG: hypothetical protein ACP5EP_03025, partial [Acidobacteriaceae bacterium]
VQVDVPCSATEVGVQVTLTEVMVVDGGGGVPPPPLLDPLLHPVSVPKVSRPRPNNSPGTIDKHTRLLLLLRMAVSPLWIALYGNRHKVTTVLIEIQQQNDGRPPTRGPKAYVGHTPSEDRLS